MQTSKTGWKHVGHADRGGDRDARRGRRGPAFLVDEVRDGGAISRFEERFGEEAVPEEARTVFVDSGCAWAQLSSLTNRRMPA
eukprot:CAMPEP_0113925406 /NCGR_PEP_ID=MMETSP1159-20121227/3181_1 /TAXON_ID=88271 /ORGANISM="Picocystis salinarum" /LENGTH=82 /DNA_ID=CAMNT_0000925683 /DNA_START=1 /DNA_END=250 /DNA_ORIENTATION=- /assembly_acc=CAM_ASM_000767